MRSGSGSTSWLVSARPMLPPSSSKVTLKAPSAGWSLKEVTLRVITAGWEQKAPENPSLGEPANRGLLGCPRPARATRRAYPLNVSRWVRVTHVYRQQSRRYHRRALVHSCRCTHQHDVSVLAAPRIL